MEEKRRRCNVQTQRAEKRSALSSSQREAPRPDYMLDTCAPPTTWRLVALLVRVGCSGAIEAHRISETSRHPHSNAVCDGSSCGVRTAFTDAARRAARQRQHGAARRGLLDSADSEADVPTTATHITPPPFTIILGLHHKCVASVRLLELFVVLGLCQCRYRVPLYMPKSPHFLRPDSRGRENGVQDGVRSLARSRGRESNTTQHNTHAPLAQQPVASGATSR
jgi:hypothetical protein